MTYAAYQTYGVKHNKYTIILLCLCITSLTWTAIAGIPVASASMDGLSERRAMTVVGYTNRIHALIAKEKWIYNNYNASKFKRIRVLEYDDGRCYELYDIQMPSGSVTTVYFQGWIYNTNTLVDPQSLWSPLIAELLTTNNSTLLEMSLHLFEKDLRRLSPNIVTPFMVRQLEDKRRTRWHEDPEKDTRVCDLAALFLIQSLAYRDKGEKVFSQKEFSDELFLARFRRIVPVPKREWAISEIKLWWVNQGLKKLDMLCWK